MKGKKCIGLLTLCITFLLSLNPLSNANAVDFTANLTYVETINSGAWTCYYKRSDETALTQRCSAPAIAASTDAATVGRIFAYFKSGSAIQLKKNRLYEVRMMVSITSTQQGNEYPLPGVLNINTSQTTPDLRTIAIKQNIENTGTSSKFETYQQQTYNVEFYPQQNREYSFLLKPDNDGTINLQIGRETSQTFLLPPLYDHLYVPQVNISVNQWVNVYEYESPSDEAAEKELEDRDNLETQSEATDSEAGTASNAAETTGTTLFGAFTQLLTALTNVSGSSCTLPSMQVYSLNLGRMDLCTFTIPSQITALVSIGMVFIIVPLGIHLVKRMINLYKEITG